MIAASHYGTMKEDNWGSPGSIVAPTRAFFQGVPDLDPASDAFRNETVGARRWLGLEHVDPSVGIPLDWQDAKRVFLNPPGGCRKDKQNPKTGKWSGPSFVSLFWKRAIEQLTKVEGELIWVAYNINQLQTLQQVSVDGVRVSSVCVPSTRISYLDRDGVQKGGTPSASAILCVTSIGDPHERFSRAFGSLGAVWRP